VIFAKNSINLAFLHEYFSLTKGIKLDFLIIYSEAGTTELEQHLVRLEANLQAQSSKAALDQYTGCFS